MKKVDMKPNGPPPGAVIMQDMDNGKGDDVIAETLPEEAKDGAGIKRRAKSFCNTQGNQINNVADLREEEERKQNQRKKSMGGDEEEQLLEDLFLFGDFVCCRHSLLHAYCVATHADADSAALSANGAPMTRYASVLQCRYFMLRLMRDILRLSSSTAHATSTPFV